jgi:hypothetical protein
MVKMKTVFIADDGKEFTDEPAALKYDRDLQIRSCFAAWRKTVKGNPAPESLFVAAVDLGISVGIAVSQFPPPEAANHVQQAINDFIARQDRKPTAK